MAKKNKKSGLSAGNNSIVIGGNVKDSNIIMGDGNTASVQISRLTALFEIIHRAVEQQTLKADEKDDVKVELDEIQTALEEPNPDETFLARRFRNLKRMAPDILDVAFETLKNPVGGVAEVVKRIAKKMAEDANA